MKVRYNHFVSDFLHLNKKFSCLKIAIELAFQNRESIFNVLKSPLFLIIKLTSHFLRNEPPIISLFQERIGMMKSDWWSSGISRWKSSVVTPGPWNNNPTSGLWYCGRSYWACWLSWTRLFEATNLLTGINRDRSFEGMFSNLASSGGIIVAALPASETG